MESYWVDLLRILAVLVLVGINGYFVAAEFALVSVRWTRVEELVEEKKFGALAVREALEKMDDAIAAAQLGITLASIALGFVGEPALAHMLEPLFSAIPGPWGPAVTHGVSIGVAYLLITYLHVVLGEQAPKAVAIDRAEKVALLVTGPLLLFQRFTYPLIVAIRNSSNFVVGLMRLPPPKTHESVHSVDELQMLVDETQEAGGIAEQEAAIVRNVFELSDKTVQDVMIPREKVVTIPITATEEEVLAIARDTAHTRLPVWEGSPDHIVGIVNTKDLFHLFSLKGIVILMDAMYPPIFVKPDRPVAELLRIFRREKRPMAVVCNDEQKFLGIVTLEDILEEIVGEIEDEHDFPRASHIVSVAPRR